MSFPLSGTGVWSAGLRYGDAGAAAEAAAELEELGYTALWVPDTGGDLFGSLENLLDATSGVTIATGILNLWLHEPAETARRHWELLERFGRRTLFGIGVSHGVLVDSLQPGSYDRPLTRTREYLDALDAAEHPLPAEDRVLAALGPKMLELARDRAAGAHPYLVTPEHTAVARDALGPDRLLAPEQAVAATTDPERARALGRAHLQLYVGLPNYSGNWFRLGFTEDDLAGGGSDRLVDALVAWGDEEAIAARIDEHRAAGADHVCVQVLSDDLIGLPLEAWRRLAPVLTD